MAGTADGALLDHYLATQYEVIRVVHDHLAAIRAVASHLTPVEDLVDFQEEVSALYAKLGILTTASELILSASPQGIAMLQAPTAAAQRLLMELKSAALYEAEYFATAEAMAAAQAAIVVLNSQVALILADLPTRATKAEVAALSTSVDTRFAAVNASLTDLQAQINAIIADLQSGIYWLPLTVKVDDHEQRLDVIEGQLATLIDQYVTIDTSLTSLGDHIVGYASAINELYARADISDDGVTVIAGRLTVIETGLDNLTTGQSANSTAIQDLFSLTSMINGVTVSQAGLITDLTSRIDNAEDQVDATAMALQQLTTTVTQNGALISAVSDFSTELSSRLTDAETGLASTASATDSLTTEVTLLGDQVTIASEKVTQLSASLSSPGNLVPGSAFEADPVYGWSIFNRGAGWNDAVLSRNYNAATRVPPSMNALSVAMSTTPTGSLGIKSDNIAITGTKRYILSGWLASNFCSATLEWRLLDASGAIIQLGSLGNGLAGGGVTDLNNWPRLWGEIPANSAARELQIQVWVSGATGGPRVWLLRPMLEEVAGLQDGPSPWVPSLIGLTKANADAMSVLSARVTGVEGNYTSVASQLTGLNTQVGTMQSALVNEIITSSNKDASFAASINDLSTRMLDAENGLEAAADAVSELTTDVSIIDGKVTSHAGQLLSLQTQVDNIDLDTGGVGSAILDLNTRVTEVEGDVDANSAAILDLQATVTSSNKIFVQPTAPSVTGRTAGDLWIDSDDGNKPYYLQTGSPNTWVARPDTNKNKIFVQASAPAATGINDLWIDSDDGNKPYRWNGSAWVDISDARTTANSSAITTLQTRATAIEGVNSSQATAITALQSTVNNPTTGVSATASAVSTLQTTVNDAVGDINAQATSIQSLSTTVNGHTSTITQQATSINGLKALWNVTLDVNGYISGLYSTNNGTKADFTVLADRFRVIAPGVAGKQLFSVDATGLKLANDLYLAPGKIIIDSGTHMLVQGTGFGVGNEFIEWFGPKMAIGACARSNALSYKTKFGDGYFGGSLTAGLLRNAVASSSLVGVGNEIVCGPFNTNGQTKSVVVSYSREQFRKTLALNSTGYIAGSGSNTATVQIWRKIGTGADTIWATLNVTGNTQITNQTDGDDSVLLTWGGSITLNDSDPSVADRTYRAIITAFGQQSITRNDSVSDNTNTTTARLSIISTED